MQRPHFPKCSLYHGNKNYESNGFMYVWNDCPITASLSWRSIVRLIDEYSKDLSKSRHSPGNFADFGYTNWRSSSTANADLKTNWHAGPNKHVGTSEPLVIQCFESVSAVPDESNLSIRLTGDRFPTKISPKCKFQNFRVGHATVQTPFGVHHDD
jgi:hypothetical protein